MKHLCTKALSLITTEYAGCALNMKDSPFKQVS